MSGMKLSAVGEGV